MPAPHFDVVGVGINSVDRVAVLPSFPQPSGPRSKLKIGEFRTMCGGQTATTLVACARLGLRAKYVGAIGRDADGALVSQELAAAGVDMSSVVARDARTRFAVVLVDSASGGRAVLWDFDEKLALADGDLPVADLQRARLVHVDDVDTRAALAAAQVARAADVPVTSDIDQVTSMTTQLLEAVSVAIVAEHVPREMSGHSDLRRALLSLPRSTGQVLVVTLGERGALALDANGFHEVPGFNVRATDTTGAGDVFRAGFIYALLEGWPLEQRLRFANAAAALSCTRLGAMASVPTLEEVEEMLRRGEMGIGGRGSGTN